MIGCGVGVGLLIFWFGYKKCVFTISGYYHKAPPSLYGLPFIGSLITMLIYKENFALKVLPRYGDLVYYNIGSLNYYKINSVALSRKLFDVAKDRPSVGKIMFKIANVEAPFGVLTHQEGLYRRKKVVNHISKLLDSSTVDANICKILQEITYEYLDNLLLNKTNDLWYPRDCIRNASFNTIFLAMFNKILKIDDPVFEEFSHQSSIYVKYLIPVMISYLLPDVLANFIFGKKKQLYQIAAEKVYNVARNEYDELENELLSSDGDDSSGDDENRYIKLAQWYINDDKLSKDVIVADLANLLLAGIDTTSHSLEVGILLLAKYPTVQDRIYNELKNVFRSNDNQFDLSNMNILHQFKAFIYETIRISCPAPDGLMRTCDKDIRCVKFANGNMICDYVGSKNWNTIDNENMEYDYIVEKNSWIEINIAYLLKNNKNVWNLDVDPMTLNLDYWLKKDGNNVKFYNNHNIVTFGVGARKCPGQLLAIKQLFAFFGNLLLIKVSNCCTKQRSKINEYQVFIWWCYIIC